MPNIKTKKKKCPRLTDEQKKKIIADYVNNQNLRETARMNNVSDTTVKRIVNSDKETLQRVAEKKEENTKNILEMITKESSKRANVISKIVNAIDDKAEHIDQFTSIRDLSTAYGTMIDKELKFLELQLANQEDNRPIVTIPAKDIGKAFVDLNRWINMRKFLEYWLEGGRGSIKSSYWSEKATEILENNPNMCAILIRKVANTLKDSVYSQMQWGIDKLSETYPTIKKDWQALKSPLEFHNKRTNQKIYLRGADDPGKIKSIKPPPGMYIGLIIYEEFDQMNGMEEVGTIDRSLIRGGEDFIVFRVYNTPKSKNHFVNKEKRIPKANRYIHRSTYLDVPIEWLGKPFFDEAEYMKEVNPKNYANVYLGEETGDGGNVFENVELREISDKEIENFDYLYQGLDFGWYPDPLAWTKMCYQPSKLTLYIFDEFVVNKMSNLDVWNHLQKEKGVKNDDLITGDSVSPKDIADFQSYGSLMRGAKKGPDTVDYSMKWLARLAKIVIDPKRCPKSAEEFTTYEHPQDKDGNYISGYIDSDNHCIDSVRYALNPIWRRKGE